MTERLLLTPGPLTTDLATRSAMMRDWGSREPDFIALTTELRQSLLRVAGADEEYAAVPLQGAGTFAVEAMICSLVSRQDKLLVLVNGAYGERMVTIAERHGLSVRALRWPFTEPIDPPVLDRALGDDPEITHVAVVHCETTTGILNPLAEVAEVVRARGRKLIVDAMSSFGALPIEVRSMQAMAVAASSNKALQGAPGLSFVIAKTAALTAAEGVSPSLSFDLHDQWRYFESSGQWRFTPPVQVVAALVEALRQLHREGGPDARRSRYQASFDTLTTGMENLGFRLLLDPSVRSPIIATFISPEGFEFDRFYGDLLERGFVIYPGKLTQEATFRVGCIGAVTPEDLKRFVEAVAVLQTQTVAAAE